MLIIVFKQGDKVGGGRIEACGGGVGETELFSKIFDSREAFFVATHGLGATIIGFAYDQIEAFAECIAVGTIIISGNEFLVGGGELGVNLLISVVGEK